MPACFEMRANISNKRIKLYKKMRRKKINQSISGRWKKEIFLATILIQILIFPSATNAFNVVVATDIHADSVGKIKKENNTIYPKNYERCLNEIKKTNPNMVIFTGDLVDRGQKKYYINLRDAMQGTQTLWVKGNHDSKNFRYLAAENYYTDFENWRFIVLDSSEKFGSSTGYLDNSQISLLNEWLKTDKNVAIAMHHPPFFYNSREDIYTTDKVQLYADFFEALTPNVKYIFTGHWHFGQTSEINGINFVTQKALTQNKVCNYINLDL
ncbi:hypothetical protein D4R51_02035 [bacterium]|nr:MAG: hypothetical protein D4R51_02035 [bacterium]